MIQFAVTVFIRLQAAAYNVFFIISCDL